LERRRLRAAKITLLCLLALLVSLSIWQAVAKASDSLAVNDFMTASEPKAGADPLDIAGGGIDFVQASPGGNILWYQSTAPLAYTAMLLDQELSVAGWQALPTGQSELLSYNLAPDGSRLGATVVISIVEQGEGCSLILQLL
jgi:hypothetical protein